MKIMDLIEKYLGEGIRMPVGNAPSLDSLRYNPSKGKKLTPDDLIDLAKRIGPGMTRDITTNIAWAMKKNDKKKVKTLIDKYPENVIGMHDILNWLKEN